MSRPDILGVPSAKLLRRAAELVEQGWCKRAAARDEAGRSVSPLSLSAVRWCLTGAVERARAELVDGMIGDEVRRSPLDETTIPPRLREAALRAASEKFGYQEKGDEVRWNKHAAQCSASRRIPSARGRDRGDVVMLRLTRPPELFIDASGARIWLVYIPAVLLPGPSDPPLEIDAPAGAQPGDRIVVRLQATAEVSR